MNTKPAFRDPTKATRIPRKEPNFAEIEDAVAKRSTASASASVTPLNPSQPTNPPEPASAEHPPIDTPKKQSKKAPTRDKTPKRIAADIPAYIRSAFFAYAHENNLTIRCAIVRAIDKMCPDLKPDQDDLHEDLRALRHPR